MLFKRNLHTIDRIARVLIGIGCIYLGFFNTSIIDNAIVNLLVGIFGIVNIFAGFISACPIYSLVGFSTFRNKNSKVD